MNEYKKNLYKKGLYNPESNTQIEKEEPSATEEKVEKSVFSKAGVVIGSPYVNVRKTASPDGEIVEVLRENDLVQMLGGMVNGYYRVKTSINDEVFILSDYLKET